VPEHGRLLLDQAAIEAARAAPNREALRAQSAPWQREVIKLLNDSLATEIVCMLRYRRHHYTARGLAAPRIADEFLTHANEEMSHADRLASRILQLGGEADFSPPSLARRSHAAYDDSRDLRAMITANLVAERVAVEIYGQMIGLLGARDPTTRRLIEDILSDEQRHADELAGWLAD
jgi:bacterioferritin